MASPLSNLTDHWKKLSANQRIALSIAALLLVVIGGITFALTAGPHYARLYGNLTDEDAASVKQKLDELKIPYRIQGGNIEVPTDKVDETRITLAGEGMPQGGNSGFELFDKTQLGQSEFGEQMTYLRALQGELARSIRELRCVRDARVHLVLPKDHLYAAEEKKPTASVVLTLRDTPSPKEVKAVIHLVSSAVEGLTPENVTVVDTDGNTLSDMTDMASDVNNAVRMQAQRNEEERIKDNVQTMLDKVLGPGKAVVSANVTLNFDKTKVDRDIYTPAVPGNDSKGALPHGVLTKQFTKRETYNGTKLPSVSGGPGVVPNTSNRIIGATNTSGKDSSYDNSENTAEYMVSKEEQHIEQTPGKIDRITLGLFLDNTVDAQQISDLRNTISAAAGLVPGRDTIQLMSMPFDRSAEDAAKKAQTARDQKAQRDIYWKYGLAGLLILVFAGLLLIIYRATLAPVGERILPVEESGEQLEMLPPAEETAETYAEMRLPVANEPEELPLPEESPLLTLDPQRVAQVIKGLLTED